MPVPVLAASSIPCVLPTIGGPREGAEVPVERVRVFVVEDDALSAIMLNDLLELWGFGVCGMAHSAPAALREIERHHPDIVLMDIRLADNTDGVQAAHEIRRRFGIRSIFLTAHTDHATLTRVREAEPLGLLAKPYSPGQLHVTLLEALERLRHC